MSELPAAQEVTLRKLKPRAPAFHRHIAKSKLIGDTAQVGDRVIVYEVVATVPEGKVVVNEETVVRFE